MKTRAVAQIFNLLYRRFSTCVAQPDSNVSKLFTRPADCRSAMWQTTSLRYVVLAALCLLTPTFCPLALAQFSIDWYKIDGGGGTSTGGSFAVSGTIGQPDPNQPDPTIPPLTGGGFSLVGGFWRPPQLVWTNLAGGDWNVASNWSPNFVPSKTDNAIINVGVTVTVSSAAECFGLTLGGFNTLPTLTGGSTLTLYGASTWVNGTMSGNGRTILETNATLNVPGGVSLNTRTLENGGTILWTGAGFISVTGGAVITNRGGALFRDENVTAASLGGGIAAGRFDNVGAFRKTTGAGTTTVAAGLSFNNSGTVEIQTGTLNLAGGGTHSGSVTVPAGTALNLSGGTHTAGGSSSVTGAGQFTVSGGTATLAGLVNVNGSNVFSGGTANLIGNYLCTNNTLTISGVPGGTANFNGTGAVMPAVISLSNLGTLSGSNVVTVASQMNWTGGAMSGSGRTIIPPGATLNAALPNFGSLNTRTLENGGSVLLSTGFLAVTGGGVITNRPGATFRVEADSGLGGGAANGRFDNAGAFRKATGTGTTAIASGLTFNNSGTVEIQTGTLLCSGSFNNNGAVSLSAGTTNRLAGGGSATGMFNTPATALVEWTGGTFTLNPGVQLNGVGLYKINGVGATVVGNANVSVENLDLVNGSSTLSGTGTVTIASVMNWPAGTMDGSGRTIIPVGATLQVGGPSGVSLKRTLENGGTALWTAAGTMILLNGVITNRAGGLFNVQNAAQFFFAGGACRFDNTGTFRKSASTGTTTIGSGLNFTNYGTVDIRSGILAANGGYVSSPGALLNCALGGTTPGTNYGQLQVAGAVTLNGALSVDLINGFSPAINDSFTVVTAGTRNGTFNNFFFPSNAVTMQLSNTPNSVIARVTDVLAVPRPTLLPPELVGPDLKLTWTTVSNVTYRLEYNPNLTLSNWTALPGDVTAAGNTASKLDPRTPSNRLYRVRVLP